MSVDILPRGSGHCFNNDMPHRVGNFCQPMKASPGVIGEGRKITKTLVCTTPNTAQNKSPNIFYNQLEEDESAKRYFSNPRFVRAAHQVVQQQGPYATVPSTNTSFNPPPQIWSPSMPADDMLHGGNFNKPRMLQPQVTLVEYSKVGVCE